MIDCPRCLITLHLIRLSIKEKEVLLVVKYLRTHTHTRVTLLEFDPGKNAKKKSECFFRGKSGEGFVIFSEFNSPISTSLSSDVRSEKGSIAYRVYISIYKGTNDCERVSNPSRPD